MWQHERRTRIDWAKKIKELLDTPKHGSWFNIAEIELCAMTKQCLGRRIPTLMNLCTELREWELACNKSKKVLIGSSQPMMQESS
jgi:hypothetical protein